MSESLSNNPVAKEASSEPTASPLFIRNLTDLQTFRLANTETRRLTNGREIRPITEAEWVATATAANKSDNLIDRQSGMSGWITVGEAEDGGILVGYQALDNFSLNFIEPMSFNILRQGGVSDVSIPADFMAQNQLWVGSISIAR